MNQLNIYQQQNELFLQLNQNLALCLIILLRFLRMFVFAEASKQSFFK